MDYPRKKPEQSKLTGLVLVLLFTAPQLMIPILVIWAIVMAVKKSAQRNSQTSDSVSSLPAPSRKETFDECPQPLFCFHKDKGEHHVRKGKEIDPWDRPDIDISKYQRRN